MTSPADIHTDDHDERLKREVIRDCRHATYKALECLSDTQRIQLMQHWDNIVALAMHPKARPAQ